MTAFHLTIDRTWDDAPIGASEQVRFSLQPQPDGLHLVVSAPFHNDPTPNHPVGPTPGLWEYEVVELFVAGPKSQYTEIELAPSGHHLVLQLDGIRNPVAREIPIAFQAQIDGSTWTGQAIVPWSILPDGPHRINATAIHGTGSQRRYLTWQPLPGPAPDFHQLERFVAVTLDPA